MSNRYKEYFDNISPDKKLTEDTLRKMREEMSMEKKRIRFDIRPFAAVAACAAITVTALIISPDLKNTSGKPDINDAAVENAAVTAEAEITVSDLSVSDSSAAYIAYNTVSETEAVTTGISSVSVKESEHCVSLVPSVTHRTEQVKSSVSSLSASETDIKSEEIITEAAVTQQVVVPAFTENIVTDEPESPKETEKITQTARPDLRPGQVHDSTDVTVPQSTVPPLIDNSFTFYKTEKVFGTEIYLNYGVDYYCPVPRNVIPRAISYAEEKFDLKVLSESITDNYDITSCYSDSRDPELDYGICITIGDETDLDSFSGKFISITAALDEPYYGFDQSYFESVFTNIKGNSYLFGIDRNLSDVYFCRFSKNGLSYKIAFKGYSLDEAVSFVSQI